MSALPVTELAMTHRADGSPCVRSAAVRETATRMLRWKDAPEGCINCGQPAKAILSGIAMCATCREQRTIRSAFAPARRDPFERRSSADAEDSVLRGHAIVFGQQSLDLGGFREIIQPEAVNRVIAEQTDLLALFNHDTAMIVGRSSAGSLTYHKDRIGLAIEINPNTAITHSSNTVQMVRDGLVKGMSFAFRAIEDEWRMAGETPIREVLDMSVSEVSAVGFPAYPQTDISFGRLGRRVDFMSKVLQARMAR